MNIMRKPVKYKFDYAVYNSKGEFLGTFLASNARAAGRQIRRKWDSGNSAGDQTFKISGWSAADQRDTCYITLKATRG